MATSRKPASKHNLPAGHSYVCGDLADPAFCASVTHNIHTVVHCAALSSPWGRYADFERANITATRNLLQAAIHNGAQRFIFISSPSIYVTLRDRYDVRETDPLPAKPVNMYAATKLVAERNVLAANNAGIETLSLRPRAITGAGDTVIFPRLLRAYQENKLSIIGDGNVTADLTCVRNVIHAIELAMAAPATATGVAYNITNCAPVNLWDSINHMLAGLDLAPVTRRTPLWLAMSYAGFLEWRYRNFHKDKEPPLTRFGIGAISNSMTLNTDRARTLLNYTPIQTNEAGINEFISWYRQHHDI